MRGLIAAILNYCCQAKCVRHATAGLVVICLSVSLTGTAFGAQEFEPFEIHDIRIEGLNRVSIGNFFDALGLNMNEIVDSERLVNTAKKLFETGQFDDIQFRRIDDDLLVLVVERPSISSLEVLGNKSLSDDSLLQGLASAGLEVGKIFRRSTVEGVRRELLRQYVSQGYYGVTLEIDVELLTDNRAYIQVNIDEGNVSRIQRINVIGNKHFSDGTLLSEIELRGEGGFFAFLKGQTRNYGQEQLRADINTLRDFYLDRGYIDANIESVDVSISANRSNVFITIVLSEGSIYRIGEISLAGDLPVSEEVIRSALLIKTGDIYIQSEVTQTESLIKEILNARGYSNASVRVTPLENEADSTKTDLRVFVEAGQRAYVRRINFSGNEETRDDVMRHLMLQQEGDILSSAQVEVSKLRLERSGFFGNVSIEPRPVPESTDQVDLEVSVSEQLTGAINFSLGYNDASGTFLQLSVQRGNLFGSGKQLTLEINESEFSQSANISVFDPYFSESGVSFGWGYSNQQTNFSDIGIAGYVSNAEILNMQFGVPINNAANFNFSPALERQNITTGASSFLLFQDFINQELEEGQFVIARALFGLTRNTRNRSIFPTKGSLLDIDVDLGFGENLNYAQFSGQYNGYFTVGNNSFIIIRNEFGYLVPFGGTDLPPFFKLFNTGGPQSIRGYDFSSIGPYIYGSSCGVTSPDDQDAITDTCADVLGGSLLFRGSLEWAPPIPGLTEVDTVRPVFFIDYGNVFADSCDPNYYWVERCADAGSFFAGDARLKWSFGLSVTWITAFGPLQFVYAETPDALPYDSTTNFEFTIGRPF